MTMEAGSASRAPDGARGSLLSAGAALAAAVAAAVLLPRALVGHPVPTTVVVLGGVVLGALVLDIRRALLLLVAATPFENYLSLAVNPLAIKGLGAVVFAAFALQALAGTRRGGRPHAGLWWLTAFVILALAAATAHPNGGPGLTTLIRYLSYAALCAVAFLVLREGDLPRQVARVFVVSCCAASAAALVTLLTGGSGRAGGPLQDPNDLAFFLAAAVPLAVALSAQGGQAVRYRWLAAAGLLVLGIGGTLSRGAGLALLVLLVWAASLGMVRLRAALLAGLAIGICLLGLFAAYPQVLNQALHQKAYVAGRNVDTRTLRWAAAVRMTAASPLVGLGPGGFEQNYPAYGDARRPDDERTGVVAHEMYLEVAAELGVPALVAFAALAASAVGAASRVARGRSGGAGPSFDRTLARGVQGSLLAVLSASLFLTEQYYLPLWLLVAAAFALEARARDRAAPA